MILTALTLFFSLIQSQAACLPDSYLFNKDVNHFKMIAAEEVIGHFERAMLPKIPSDHNLVVRLESMSPRVNAEILKEKEVVSIIVWGGMLSHPKLTPAALTLLLCHELGHFLGGPPLKSRNGWSSTEGQSDYFSTSECMKEIGDTDEAEFIQAAIALTSIYAQVTGQSLPSPDRCEEREVVRTNYGYPSAQCRLDTLIAGWRGEPRPSCWFTEID